MPSRSVLRTFPSLFKSPLSHVRRHFSSRRRCIAEKDRRGQSAACYFLRLLQYTAPSGKGLLRPLPAHRQSNGEEAVRGIRIGFRSYFHRRVHFIISAIRSNESVFHISLNSGNPIMESIRFPRMVSSDRMRSRTQFELYRSRQTTANRKSGMAKSGEFALKPAKTGARSFLLYKGCAGCAFAFK